ncbi:MAG: tRNA (adenosine(37)-N6)-dimethylallyltransferase MiaA [Bacilli bacterium]
MILVIVGPTGVGKTKLSIFLAEKYNAEIISSDSVSIYKNVNIGSAKPSIEETKGIKHHFIDRCSLNEEYSVYNYQTEARKVLNELIDKKKNVVIVGGTGLYIKALLYDYRFTKKTKEDEDFSNFSNLEIKNKILSLDPNNQIHVNNRKRMIRFLNSYEEKDTNNNNINTPLYDFITIGLTTSRDKLYEIINTRVDNMIDKGLLEEASNLFNKGYKKLDYIIGYKELNKYFRKEITYKESIEEIKKNTRKYSKRQYTWFNNQMKDIKWFDTNFIDFNKTIKEIEDYLVSFNIK